MKPHYFPLLVHYKCIVDSEDLPMIVPSVLYYDVKNSGKTVAVLEKTPFHYCEKCGAQAASAFG